MFIGFVFGLVLTLPGAGSALQAPQSGAQVAPPTKCATPAECVQEIRDYVARRRQEILSPGAAQLQNAAAQKQLQQVQQERLAMAKQAAGRFDVNTVAEKDLSGLAELYVEANLPGSAKAA